MESDGGGVAAVAPVTPARLISQHSTLRESFLASDIAESHGNINNNNNNINNVVTGYPRPISSLTLGAVLNSDKKSPPPNNVVVRTLLEIIRNDETIQGGSSPNSLNKKSWKSFKERLKIKRGSLNHSLNSNLNQNHNPNSQRWAPSPFPQSDVLPSSRSSSTVIAMNANRNSLRNSLRNNSIRQVDTVPADDLALREVDSGGSPRSGGSFRLSAALAAEREQTRRRLSKELVEGNRDDNEEVAAPRDNGNGDGDEDDEEGEGEGEEHLDLDPPANQPVRMSLMDLLEETDRQAGISGPTYRLDDDEDESDEEEEEEEEEEVEDEVEAEEGGLGKGEYSCCVCMVRHKGAAFIPCGHTFCRLCSRELWVQRGNCPLCNNFILEILDIF